MNRIARFVAAAAAGGVLALSGAGMASAETATPDVSTQDRAVTQATQLTDLGSKFVAAYNSGDVAGVRSAVDALRPVLAELQTNRALSCDASQADALSADIQKALPGLPSLPGLDVLQSLLQPALSLVGLVQSLLGSLTGGGATGGLPGLPSLSGLGGLPGLGALGGLTGGLSGLPILGGLGG